MPTGAGRWLALTVALVAALYVCWQMLQPFLNVLLWAVVLVVVFMPVHRRIDARLHRPSLSAALSTLLVVITILGPATFITVAVLGELGALAGTLSTGELQRVIAESPLAQRVLSWLSPYVDIEQLQSPEVILQRLQGWSGTLANRTVGVVGGVVSAVVQTLLVVFTMFYLFRDGDAIRYATYDVVPLERSQAAEIVARTREVVAASVYGVLVISAIQGVLGGAVFWALGLPSPLLWGVVMFFLSMIPMAGAFLVWAPAAAYLAFSGDWGKAIFLTAWGVLVVGSIDNFLSPRLVGKRARLHELLIFFSVLGGLQVFGVLGLVLGPVTVAFTLALFEVVRQANRPPAQTRREETVIERQAEVRQAS
ncbi:MAG: AI-2E family transporter [Luteitalea sp.]|nr:AI-2E family transporter [Luteitalea sp.]